MTLKTEDRDTRIRVTNCQGAHTSRVRRFFMVLFANTSLHKMQRRTTGTKQRQSKQVSAQYYHFKFDINDVKRRYVYLQAGNGNQGTLNYIAH